MSKCKSCPAEIRFCKTAEGNWIPIDRDPNPKGNLILDGQDDQGNPLVRLVDLFTSADAIRYMPHWVTCPDADSFRDQSTPPKRDK